ncbi:hypothetical protein ACHAXT_005387 [Thalassiosira profunda]
MSEERRIPITCCHKGDGQLPSFPALREKNLRTLYGNVAIGGYVGDDKSPKGSVDEKIRPLVDLINSHPEYVTLSSCSGRVALFDPGGSSDGSNDDSSGVDGRIGAEGNGDVSTLSQKHKVKGTEISGKGRGRWIFVTHDILPDLGPQIVQSLRDASQERGVNCNQPPITFKHEPPLVHVGASSLAAGKRLLHLAKSTCAMRESGLVVTDSRVTVELRTTGTMLCAPLMVDGGPTPSLVPGEGYLLALADMANERMAQNEKLLDKLHAAVLEDLFEVGNDEMPDRLIGQLNGDEYNLTLQPLPELNLWKTAAVALPRNDANGNNADLDVLAFGGQGIGPNLDGSNGKAATSQRWDAVFRLAMRNGAWSDRWDAVPIACQPPNETVLTTNAGNFRVQPASGMGPREGHCACIFHRLGSEECASPSAIAIFGGRTGGPLSPSNDFFIYVSKTHGGEEGGMFGRPIDVRGTPPEPRFGHSMTVLRNQLDAGSLQGEPLAVVAGGTGVSGGAAMTLSSVHVLSRIADKESERSHFLWERVADMPSPRSYHTAFVNDGSDSLFIFGGASEADDPFGPSKAPGNFSMSLAGNGITNSDGGLDEMTSRIGSSAAILQLGSNDVLLQVGGATSPASLDSEPGSGAQKPINVFFFRPEQNGSIDQLKRDRTSSIEHIGGSLNEGESRGGVDLGACVHHCLAPLPKRKGSDTASAIIVGGGVPSFSFGQSYARSYLITVSCADTMSSSENRPTDHVNRLKTLRISQSQVTTDTKHEADVIYVPARHAKEVKVELAFRGLLEKRYKMIKVPGKDPAETVVAIPVTEQCLNQPLDNEYSLGFGKELVPLSSSSIGKLKQGKALR